MYIHKSECAAKSLNVLSPCKCGVATPQLCLPLSEYTTLTWSLTYTYNTMYLLCIYIVILYGLPVLFTVVLGLVLQVSIIIIMIRTCLYVYVFVSLPVCVCK